MILTDVGNVLAYKIMKDLSQFHPTDRKFGTALSEISLLNQIAVFDFRD